MVIGIIVKIAIDFENKYIKSKISSLMADFSSISMLYKIDIIYILLFAFLASFFCETTQQKFQIKNKKNFLLLIIISKNIFISLLIYGYFTNNFLFEMFKVEAIAFENEITILPILENIL